MSKIGYIRVSTEKQETARQQEIMNNYQVDRIFSEKLSGANTDRPQLKAMLDYVREGDTLYIESISRLGRSTRDLLSIIDKLTAKGVKLVSSKENMARAMEDIREELQERLAELQAQGKLLEAQRLEQRTNYDLEMMEEMGYCNGIENYSRHLTKRRPGEPPFTLVNYFK